MRAQKDAQGIYDFDALVVEPRLARVGGEVVDVSMMPVAVSLALAKRGDMSKEEMMSAATADSEGELRKVLKMVSDVCVVSNPNVTVDFLMSHLDGPKLTAFTKFVLQPMTDKAEEFEEAGNAVSGETT
jgi:hypothetical protein